jgi:hypothetical protein
VLLAVIADHPQPTVDRNAQRGAWEVRREAAGNVAAAGGFPIDLMRLASIQHGLTAPAEALNLVETWNAKVVERNGKPQFSPTIGCAINAGRHRAIERLGAIKSHPILGGLHHFGTNIPSRERMIRSWQFC